MATQTLDYLFIAEALNGNIIKQTPDDTSRLNANKSAFYDVLQNLPLKTFSLVGKGHVFMVDFTDLSISIDGSKQFCPRPPAGSKITPIYWIDTVQVSKHQREQETTIISKLTKRFVRSSHANTKAVYRIGFQAHYPNPVNGKRNMKYEMTIE